MSNYVYDWTQLATLHENRMQGLGVELDEQNDIINDAITKGVKDGDWGGLDGLDGVDANGDGESDKEQFADEPGS